MQADVRNVIQAQIRIIRSLKLAALQLEYTADDVLSLSWLPDETTSELREERADGWVNVTGLLGHMSKVIGAMKAGGETLPSEAQNLGGECDRYIQKLEKRISLRAELEEKGKKERQAKERAGLSDSTDPR
jgi:hypothetical protein